jgi:hypothetical protein
MSNHNSVVTPVSSLFALPTVADGSLKQRLWTTIGNQTILSNVLTVENDAPASVYHYTTDKATYAISTDVLAARALYESFKGDGAPLDDLLQIMSEGYLNQAQKTAKLGATPAVKRSLLPTAKAERVLTADEYLTNCIKLATPDLSKFYAKSSAVTDKTTKPELLTIIHELTEQLVTPAQVTQFESIKLMEAEELKKYAALTEIGFTNISRLSTGLINTRISMLDFAANALTKLVSAGFQMSGSITPVDGNMFAVQLIEGTPTI